MTGRHFVQKGPEQECADQTRTHHAVAKLLMTSPPPGKQRKPSQHEQHKAHRNINGEAKGAGESHPSERDSRDALPAHHRLLRAPQQQKGRHRAKQRRHMVRDPQNGVLPGVELVDRPPLHFAIQGRLREEAADGGHQVRARNREQTDGDDGLPARLLPRLANVPNKQGDHGYQTEARPNAAGNKRLPSRNVSEL